MKKDINKDIVLFAFKIAVFGYILTSPFIDHKKYLGLLDTMFAKVLILVLIVAASLVDFQLAILITIALFVMIINFNKEKIGNIMISSPIVPIKPVYIAPESSITKEKFYNSVPEQKQNTKNFMVVPYAAEDNMFTFPNDTCNTKPFEDISISTDLIGRYIDPKVKPYEVYIRMITNGDNIEKAQSNLVSEM